MEFREDSGPPPGPTPESADFMSDLLADLMSDWDTGSDTHQAAASTEPDAAPAPPELTLAAFGEVIASEPPDPPAPAFAAPEDAGPVVASGSLPRTSDALSPVLAWAGLGGATGDKDPLPAAPPEPEPFSAAIPGLPPVPPIGEVLFEEPEPEPPPQPRAVHAVDPEPWTPPAISWLEFDEPGEPPPPAPLLELVAAPEPEPLLASPVFEPPVHTPLVSGPGESVEDSALPVFDDLLEELLAEVAPPPVEALPDRPSPPVDTPEPAEPAGSIETDDGTFAELLAGMDAELASVDAPEPVSEPVAATRVERLILFSAHGVGYALPVANVVETDRVPATTMVPGTPEFVRGVANLRGEIVPVLDFGSVLGVGPVEHATRLLVVRGRDASLTAGFVVDKVSGAAVLPIGEIHGAPALLDERSSRVLRGLARHGGGLVNVLDAEKLFAAAGAEALAG